MRNLEGTLSIDRWSSRISRTRVLLKIVYGSVAITGCVIAAWADTPQNTQNAPSILKQLSLEQLGNVEVTTASKEPEELWKTPAAIFVLTQEDIRRSGATSIPEVLRLVPGVEVARSDSDHWAVGIRGFGSVLSRSVLVLIDGRSVYTPLFAGVFWQVQNVLLEDVERIEVIRGPGGTIWGANAVNGVINIITKSAKETHGGLVSVGGGNLDRGMVGFRYGGSNGANFDYRIYCMAFNRAPQFHTNQAGIDEWTMGQFGFRTDWNLRDRDALTLQGDFYKGLAGNSVSVSLYSPPSIAVVAKDTELSGANLLARWRRTLRPGSDIQLQVYYDRTDRKDVNFGEVRNTFDADFIHHFNLSWGQDFIWGLGVRFSAGNFTQVVPTVVFTPDRFTEKLYSAFVQDQIPIVRQRLSLTLGTKLLHNNYSGFEYQPSARLLWTPTQRQSFWTSVTRAVRTPSRVDEQLQFTALFLPSLPAYLRLTGDGQFTSEHMLAYEAGYRALAGSRFFVDVSAFYNDYNDLESVEAHTPFVEIVPPLSRVVLPVLLRNLVKGNTAGVEVAPTWTLKSWWQLKGSYSYIQLDLRNKPGSVDGSTVKSIEGSSPHHQVVIQSLTQLPRNLELDLTFRFVSALPAQSVGAYTTGDARLGWCLGDRLELSFVGQNLFQPFHAEFSHNPAPIVSVKRSAYVKFVWRR